MLETFPIVLARAATACPFTAIGGNDNTYPQGRKVTQWQINDNLIWTRERNSYKFGINTRRIDVSNYDLGEGTVPTVVYNDLARFTYGAAYTASQTFPVSLKERVSAGNLDLYAMDTYKPAERMTLTAGIRATWNTNPVNRQRSVLRAQPGPFWIWRTTWASLSIRRSRRELAACSRPRRCWCGSRVSPLPTNCAPGP